MEEKHVTPLKAIRLKCIDCCGGSSGEVKRCTASSCAIHPYRMGKNPRRKGIGGNGCPGVKKDDSVNELPQGINAGG